MTKTIKQLILFGLTLCSVAACKDDEIPQPESVTLSTSWEYPIPEGERTIWIDATDQEVLYLTLTESKMTTYLFNHSGDLLHTFIYTDPRLIRLDDMYRFKMRKDDWLAVKYFNHQVFLNIKTGESHYVFDDRELIRDSTFNYYLSTKNSCYFNRMDASKQCLLYKWDFQSNSKELVDTLLSSLQYPSYLGMVGEYTSFNSNYNSQLLYFHNNHEFFSKINAYSLLGYGFSSFYGNAVWRTDTVFRNKELFYSGEDVFLYKDLCFFMLEKELFCLSPVHQKILWSREIDNYINSEMIGDGDNLYLSFDFGTTSCIDIYTGETIWHSNLGDYTKKMAVGNHLLTAVGFQPTSQELFPHRANYLNIVDSRTGANLLRTANPLPRNEAVPINNIWKGLSRYTAQSSDMLFLSDHKSFFAMQMTRNYP